MRFMLRLFLSLMLMIGVSAFMLQDGTVSAQPKAGPIVVAPQAPVLNPVFPLGVQRGQALELNLAGTNLADPIGLWTSFPAKVTVPTEMNNGKDAAKVKVKIEVPADAPLGVHTLRYVTKNGVSNARVFCVDEFPQVDETADNKTKEKAQVIAVPSVIIGKTEAEVSDYFKFNVTAGQRLTLEVLARRIGSTLDPIIKLYDAKSMREMPGFYSDDEPGLQSDCRLTRVFPTAGEIIVEVRDSRHQGGAEAFYRLRIADVPNAMAALPSSIQRGKKASVQFTGKDVNAVPPVEVTMPEKSNAVQVPVKGPGNSGWPISVNASNINEIVETEPNNEISKAQKIELPVGITGRFLDKGDLDHYVFTAKKGAKYTLTGETYEINSPAEVFLVIKDMKGAELAKSNPANTPAKIEFTAPADGDFVIVAEHLNYAHGPLEVYHLIVEPNEPDFAVSVLLDRVELTAGGSAIIPVAGIVRKDYTGPVEVTVESPVLEGTTTITNAAAPQPGVAVGYLPVTAKAGTPVGGVEFRIIAKATINGKVVTRYATVTDIVKTSLNGLAFPPREMLTSLSAAIIPSQLFTLSVKVVPADVVKGTPANVTITAKRADGFAEEIAIAPVNLPANVTAAVKPIPKGANEVTFPLTVPANAVAGTAAITFRGSAKVAGKDVAYYSPMANLVIIEPKKEEPKKTEPKKEVPKKK